MPSDPVFGTTASSAQIRARGAGVTMFPGPSRHTFVVAVQVYENQLSFGSTSSSEEVSHLDDAGLVQMAIAHGGDLAFEELVRRHQGTVRGLLLRLTANRTLADDLAQEVFLRAYRGLRRFEGRARFSTWIYRIAYNAFLSHRSRARVLAALPEGFEARTPAPELAESAARCDLRRDLSGAIAALDDKHRAVVVLYYIEQLTYPEIADLLDKPLGTIKTDLHRARKILREHMLAEMNTAEA